MCDTNATTDDIENTIVNVLADRAGEAGIDHATLVVSAEYRHGVDHTVVESILDDMEDAGKLRCAVDGLGTPRWTLP